MTLVGSIQSSTALFPVSHSRRGRPRREPSCPLGDNQANVISAEAFRKIRLGAVKRHHAQTVSRLKQAQALRSATSNLKAKGTLERHGYGASVFSSARRFADDAGHQPQPGFQGAKVIGKKLKDEDKFPVNVCTPYYLARTKAQVAPHLKPIECAGTHPPGNPDGPVHQGMST